MFEILGAIGGIILVDLVLSGDNALVIGAAAAGLPRAQRRLAIISGGAAAVVLRIGFAIAATLLLQVQLLQAIGGLILVVIAVRLLMDRSDPAHGPDAAALSEGEKQTAQKSARRGFLSALLTIMVADVTMSLDNVLAVGAIASGHIPLLIAGVLLSVTLLLLGSALVAELIGRLPLLLDLAAVVLGLTAAHMLLDDKQVGPLLARLPLSGLLVPAVVIGVVLAADIWLRLRAAGRLRVE